MGDAEGKSIRDIVKDIQRISEQMRLPRIGPFSVMVPDAYAKYAANLYTDQNVIVHTNNGSIYQYGVQIKSPGTHLDVRRLNEKIATMDLPTYGKRHHLPTYVKRIQTIPPELRKVYLLGEWDISEKGE